MIRHDAEGHLPDDRDVELTPAAEKSERIVRECFASGEPVFALRAKDCFSTATLMSYRSLIQSQGAPDPQFLAQLDRVIGEFETWQEENPSNLKHPD